MPRVTAPVPSTNAAMRIESPYDKADELCHSGIGVQHGKAATLVFFTRSLPCQLSCCSFFTARGTKPCLMMRSRAQFTGGSSDTGYNVEWEIRPKLARSRRLTSPWASTLYNESGSIPSCRFSRAKRLQEQGTVAPTVASIQAAKPDRWNKHSISRELRTTLAPLAHASCGSARRLGKPGCESPASDLGFAVFVD